MTRSMLLRLNGRTANEDDVWAVTEQPYPGEPIEKEWENEGEMARENNGSLHAPHRR
jgi:hypothetical protein